MKNVRTAIINSLGVLIYVAIVSTVMTYAEKIFGKMNTIVGAVGFLMLFTLSAGVVGSLIIGKPIMLYIDNKKKEAVSLLVWTLVFLAIITIAVLIYLGVR
ncbi:MAG: hypothetical protein OEV37_01765 [Candidatus Berkelbacteria bacterium]|nr:hypothetical protein [Candidatus Berkelbacteria bacterium]